MPRSLAAAAFALAFAGAAVLHAPAAVGEPSRIALAPGAALLILAAPLRPGDSATGQACTLTTIGYDDEERLVGITAGHCAKLGRVVNSEIVPGFGQIGQIVRVWHNMSLPPVVDATHTWGDDIDFAVIEFDPDKVVPSAEAADKNGRGIIVGDVGGRPRAGDKVCKIGRTTGHTCGAVTKVQDQRHEANFCMADGDSGAPVFVGGRIVGLVTTVLTTVGSKDCGTERGSNLDSVLRAIGPGVGEGFHPFTG